MPALTVPALAAAALLAVAGAQKLLDPSMTVGALRALRLPSSPTLVRAGSALELGIGVGALSAGGAVLWGLVSLSYLAFAAFVAAALRAGTMIGSCGCFGREDTPPHRTHVLLNVVLAALAGATAATSSGPLVDALTDDPGRAVPAVALAIVALGLLWAVYVELPRTLAARPPGQP